MQWPDTWNIRFFPALKQGEIEAMDYALQKIPDITNRQIIAAIISLDESGRYQPFKSKPAQLKTEIIRNRRRRPYHDPAPNKNFHRIAALIKATDDPQERWRLLCEEPGKGTEGVYLSRRLEAYAETLPGGAGREDISDVKQACSEIGKVDKSEAGV